MNFLLDTHTLLWWLADSPMLPSKSYDLIRNPDNIVYISAATVWEISIKKSLGKLNAPPDLEEEIKTHQFLPLSVTITHALFVEHLPFLHKDPFDRLLIAQAITENLTLLTQDTSIRQYDVKTI